MKTIPIVPACQNIEEIHRLSCMIEDFIHPEMIILFGRYAGMALHDIRGGYEMLILTADRPKVGIRELAGYLDSHFPVGDRKEKYLSLHLLTVNFVHHRSTQSHFLYTIRNEGILLYKSPSCKLKAEVHYKPTRCYRQAEGYSDLCLALGRAFLQDARRQQQNGIPRLSAFYLSQAVTQFLRAAAFVYYGFIPEQKEDLLVTYLRVRNCSAGMACLWAGDGWLSEWTLFGRLQSFCYKARYSYPFTVDSDLLARCMASALKTEKVAGDFCAERLRLLDALTEQKVNS